MSRPAISPCGTRAARVRGCDCDACRKASTAYHRDWRTGRTAGRVSDTVEALPTVDPRCDWMTHAACNGLPADWFFPNEKGCKQREIQAVCRACHVRAECLDWAIRNCINEGWWGGLPPRDRRRLRLAGWGDHERT